MSEEYIDEDFVEVVKHVGFSLKNVKQNKELFLFRIAPGLINPSDLINKEVVVGDKKRALSINGKKLEVCLDERNLLKNSSVLVPDSKTGELQPIDRIVECQITLTKAVSIKSKNNIDLSPYKMVQFEPPDLTKRDFFGVTKLPKTWKKLKKKLEKDRLKAQKNNGIKQERISPVNSALDSPSEEAPKKKKKKKNKRSAQERVKEPPQSLLLATPINSSSESLKKKIKKEQNNSVFKEGKKRKREDEMSDFEDIKVKEEPICYSEEELVQETNTDTFLNIEVKKEKKKIESFDSPPGELPKKKKRRINI